MSFWKYALYSPIILVLIVGTAAAEKETQSVSDQSAIDTSALVGVTYCMSNHASGNVYSQYRSDDVKPTVVSSNPIKVETQESSIITFHNKDLIDGDLEGTLIADEGLGHVSGGSGIYFSPDVVRQRLFAIVLWDEGKTKRSSTYDQGNGQISSIISIQGR